MKNFWKFFGLIAFVTLIGFSMAACSSDDDKPSDGNLFVGTWTDGELTVICTATTWTASMPGYGSWSGPYTLNGNSANFTETNGSNFGTATISGNTMTVASTYGTFLLAKK